MDNHLTMSSEPSQRLIEKRINEADIATLQYFAKILYWYSNESELEIASSQPLREDIITSISSIMAVRPIDLDFVDKALTIAIKKCCPNINLNSPPMSYDLESNDEQNNENTLQHPENQEEAPSSSNQRQDAKIRWYELVIENKRYECVHSFELDFLQKNPRNLLLKIKKNDKFNIKKKLAQVKSSLRKQNLNPNSLGFGGSNPRYVFVKKSALKKICKTIEFSDKPLAKLEFE